MKRAVWTICTTVFSLAVCASAFAQTEAWKPVGGKIMTRSAGQVNPEHPLPEYPRPQMKRDNWISLNGLWDFDLVEAKAKPGFARKILVPFPVESALSGIGEGLKPGDSLHYRRTFTVPESMKDKRVLLHFGAVDWEAKVFVNGHELGTHRGGYAPFHFDVTDALNESGEQQVQVVVKDPTDRGFQPLGKQVLNPKGIFYTAVSGIWGTVWLELVASKPPQPTNDLFSQGDKTCTAPSVTAHCCLADSTHFLGTLDIKKMEESKWQEQRMELNEASGVHNVFLVFPKNFDGGLNYMLFSSSKTQCRSVGECSVPHERLLGNDCETRTTFTLLTSSFTLVRSPSLAFA